jgi:hypothetical protein
MVIIGLEHYMNTKILIGGAVALVVLGGAYFLTTRDGADKQEETQVTDNMKGGFAELVRAGGSFECTFEYKDETNESSGKVYMTAGAERLRGDFNITDSQAGAMEMHVIRDGGYNYLWGSTMPQGIKTAVTANEMLFEEGDNSPVDENVDYECRRWNVDGSKFSLPAGVEFQDMSAWQGSVGADMNAEVGAGASANPCQACDMIGDANAKASCKAALGCQ